MRNIIKIQHTQSEQHTNKMIGSLGGWSLTEFGIKQAHSIGKNLADEYKNQEFVIYSSDLPRAKQTAESGIIRQMLRYSAPLIPTSALWWSIAYFDRFLLLSYHGAALIGLYAAAGRIPSLLTFGAGIFFEAWQFTALRAPEEQRAALFERIYGMLSAGLVALALALILSSRLLVGVIFASDFADAALYVPFLIVGAVFSALSSFLGS